MVYWTRADVEYPSGYHRISRKIWEVTDPYGVQVGPSNGYVPAGTCGGLAYEINSGDGEVLLESFIMTNTIPGVTYPAGEWSANIYLDAASGGTNTVTTKVYKRNSGSETWLFSISGTPPTTGGGEGSPPLLNKYTSSQSEIVLQPYEKLVFKVYFQTTSVADITMQFGCGGGYQEIGISWAAGAATSFTTPEPLQLQMSTHDAQTTNANLKATGYFGVWE